MRLSTELHDRDVAGLRYVYPVLSRRAGGVSVGINLNPNKACNWRCAYCQVPGLVFGAAPEIDLELLERELRRMLRAILEEGYMEEHVPAEGRRLSDVAFSGDGEPTSSPRFREAVAVAGRVLGVLGLLERVKVVLITNGSLVHRPEVLAALREMAEIGGEVWFKIDSATEEGQRRTNTIALGPERTLANLVAASQSCPTWVQTIAFARRGEPPAEEELEAYLALLDRARAEGAELQGVLLYGLARPSHQPEAPELAALARDWMEGFAERIRGLGLEVRLSV